MQLPKWPISHCASLDHVHSIEGNGFRSRNFHTDLYCSGTLERCNCVVRFESHFNDDVKLCAARICEVCHRSKRRKKNKEKEIIFHFWLNWGQRNYWIVSSRSTHTSYTIDSTQPHQWSFILIFLSKFLQSYKLECIDICSYSKSLWTELIMITD